MQDYNKYTFRITKDKNGGIHYFMVVHGEHIEVSYDVYHICKRDYDNEINYIKRKIKYDIINYGDVEILKELKEDNFTYQLYLKETTKIVYNAIELMEYPYKEIAYYLFIEELKIRTIAHILGLSKSDVSRKKQKIQKYLQEIIKNSGTK